MIVQGEDPDLVRDFLGARELVAAWQAGAASPGDVAAALANLREIPAVALALAGLAILTALVLPPLHEPLG